MQKDPSPFAELIRLVKTQHERPYAVRRYDELANGALLCSLACLASNTDVDYVDSFENLHHQCRLDLNCLRILRNSQDRLEYPPFLSKTAQEMPCPIGAEGLPAQEYL